MIRTFDLVKPDTVSDERLFALVQRARRIAIEIDGVYDLALYQTEKGGLWQCSVDAEDERACEQLRDDSQFRHLVKEVKALGVQILPKDQLERRI
jgi:hypothetical protein